MSALSAGKTTMLSPTPLTMNVRQYIFEEPNTTFVRFADAANYVHPNKKFNSRTFDKAIIELLIKLNVKVDEPLTEDLLDDFMEHGLVIDISNESEENIDEFIRHTAHHDTILKCKASFYKPLHLAAEKGDFQLVKNLAAAGANLFQSLSPLGYGETPLESAIRGDNPEIVKYLIDRGVNFRNTKEEDDLVFLVLVYAFRFKSRKVINAYLTEDTDVRYVSWSYGSLIHCAIYNGDLDLIQRLLDLGAYVNSLSIYSEKFKWFHGTLTPLQTAIAIKRVDIVKLLIRNGANVDHWLPDLHDHKSTLQFAVDINAPNDMIVALLDAGADVFNHWGDYILPFNYKHRHPSFTNILKKMAVKLDTVGYNLLKTNKVERILKDKKLDQFKRECFEEVKRMDSTQIKTTSVTYYELLTRHVHDLARDEHYDVLKSVVLNEDLEKQFPLYAGIIQTRFKSAVETRAHLPDFENLMLSIFPNASIPLINKLIPFICEEGLEAFKSKGRFVFQDMFNLPNF
ncbi:Similar to RF_0381: Putative ankyrin repeat protein RF_0381 (Rickettsia felis (strain ATCC VR-1525 / URRWXCal2)) [Cotesia congregata]|uniref:Similar to RF_0381: Putative ankyrin repeat protein RF_0381 (Rickettsia felis (Strain ATCC VR-1525 / URRWXCal2)) n=1 Tax=Cotesia congregata TaxID=51543 RepID=A0A8J2HGK7_COTCN|nr:Similar to RF_0381: Putative ankyrin repeat protein RF_0381 (Rickettsia felis (strain ATCC VR-1525 / URRWXCal2)) [Cotesia congregata]